MVGCVNGFVPRFAFSANVGVVVFFLVVVVVVAGCDSVPVLFDPPFCRARHRDTPHHGQFLRPFFFSTLSTDHHLDDDDDDDNNYHVEHY